MAMNELRKEVEAAAMAELNRANAKFPLFNSTHEGYAVILEEAEEAQEAMENVKTSLAVLWDRVKGIEVACFLDEDTTPTAIFHQAIDAACEMVQTAAMLLKYEMSMGAAVKMLKANGHKVILWTSRAGRDLEAAVEWCHGQGLEFDAVNEPLPEQVARWGNDTRKVYADFYIDDKAMSVSELEAIMDKVVDIVGEYVNQ